MKTCSGSFSAESNSQDKESAVLVFSVALIFLHTRLVYLLPQMSGTMQNCTVTGCTADFCKGTTCYHNVWKIVHTDWGQGWCFRGLYFFETVLWEDEWKMRSEQTRAEWSCWFVIDAEQVCFRCLPGKSRPLYYINVYTSLYSLVNGVQTFSLAVSLQITS